MKHGHVSIELDYNKTSLALLSVVLKYLMAVGAWACPALVDDKVPISVGAWACPALVDNKVPISVGAWACPALVDNGVWFFWAGRRRSRRETTTCPFPARGCGRSRGS